MSAKPIYLDYQATTPVDRRVLDAMLPYFTEHFGNASSTDHVFGAEAAAATEAARLRVARLIRAQPAEIIFTSGATESNNLAILGVAQQLREHGTHIITAATEHKAVLETCGALQSRGYRITLLPVDRAGRVDPDEVRHAITAETILISVMTANNEIGTLAPIKEIGATAREHGILFHTDAAQAGAYVDIDVDRDHIDLLSLSAHKMYGPKGVGALYVRRRQRWVRITPQIFGGGHERGFRSGTLNVPGIVGMGAAAELATSEPDARERIACLRDRFRELLSASVPELIVNGSSTERLPSNLSITIPGVNNRSLVVALRDRVALSTGSACTTTHVEPSHVLRAIGCDVQRTHETIRISVGRFTTATDIEVAAAAIAAAARDLRRLSRFAIASA